MPKIEGVVTVTFDEQGGKTTLTLQAVYERRDARDMMIKMQMVEGLNETFDRLAEHLATMA